MSIENIYFFYSKLIIISGFFFFALAYKIESSWTFDLDSLVIIKEIIKPNTNDKTKPITAIIILLLFPVGAMNMGNEKIEGTTKLYALIDKKLSNALINPDKAIIEYKSFLFFVIIPNGSVAKF